jgi:hypothetical protein
MPFDLLPGPLPARRRRFAALLTVAVLALAPGLARAQLRSLPVPADAGVVVAARGQAQPRLVAPPARPAAPQVEAPAPVQLPPGGMGLSAPLGLLLPAAAGALLGGALAGGGSGGSSGTSGLARTR